jgi:hypothetical protein
MDVIRSSTETQARARLPTPLSGKALMKKAVGILEGTRPIDAPFVQGTRGNSSELTKTPVSTACADARRVMYPVKLSTAAVPTPIGGKEYR